jgi:hypothetical protein
VPDALVPPPTNLLDAHAGAKEPKRPGKNWTNASQRPDAARQWQTKEPTEKEQADFFLPFVLALMDKAKDFYTRFPTDTHASEARKQEFDMTGVADEHGRDQSANPAWRPRRKSCWPIPPFPKTTVSASARIDIERAAKAKESEGEAASLAEFEKGIRALQKEFPKRPEILQMLLELADNLEATKPAPFCRRSPTAPAPAMKSKNPPPAN